MKILYVKLKNFATIQTAMHKHEIEIDLRKTKNKVVLLVGDNGSGKTSILSTLHPFAYAGSMDTRNNTNLIIDGKDGYKEIHYDYEDSLYIIKHFYTYSKRGTTVKSFISRNGDELNPNGNVTSFLECVKNELHVELNLLRLLRLGSNVSNLIDMKSTERKSYCATELLGDINIYTELFKNVSDSARTLKNMIKSVSDKIDKLNVVDKSLIEDSIKKREVLLSELKGQRDQTQKNLGSVENHILSLIPEGEDYINNKIKELIDDVRNIQNDVNKYTNKLNKMPIVIINSIDDEIQRVESSKQEYENQLSVNKNVTLFYKEQLSKVLDERDKLLTDMKLLTSNVEYSRITTLHLEISNKIKEMESNFIDGREPIYTKDNLMILMDVLKEINNTASNIYGFDKRAKDKVVTMLIQGESATRYVNNLRSKSNKTIFSDHDIKQLMTTKEPLFVFRPSDCRIDGCPLLYIHKLFFENDTESTTDTDMNEIALLDDMDNVISNIDYIFMILKSNASLISKGASHIFSVENVLKVLLDGRTFVSEDELLTDMISDAEDYQELQDLKITMKELNTELKLINSNKNNIDALQSAITTIDLKISELESSINKNDKESDKIQLTITSITELLDMLNEYKTLSDYILDGNKNIEDLNNQLNKYNEILQHVTGFINQKASLNNDIERLNWNIKREEDNLFNEKIIIRDFDNLTKEREMLDDKFEDVAVVREALSSNKGIPLLFMQLYLKNTKMYVNHLLQSIYKDDFEIDDFDISDTEFNIPYIKNGIRINDVAYASQGEKSFLSLALSFALINQSIKEYNILLLDEIDSTLDIRNRAMFLNILEKQMESISAEQIFLITHNNMFDNYPVDIILTSNSRLDSYNNANVVFNIQ